jgi:hypothetical protein
MPDEAPPDSARYEAVAHEREDRRAVIGASYVAARRAIALVREYRQESGTTGRRERECLAEVARLRRAIADLRAIGESSERSAIPGLRKVDGRTPSHDGAAPTSTSRRAG